MSAALTPWFVILVTGRALTLWFLVLLTGHGARAVSRGQQRRRYGLVDEKLANRWRYFVELIVAACVVFSLLRAAGQVDRCSPTRSQSWAECATTAR